MVPNTLSVQWQLQRLPSARPKSKELLEWHHGNGPFVASRCIANAHKSLRTATLRNVVPFLFGSRVGFGSFALASFAV
jgi:hypothetical protein